MKKKNLNRGFDLGSYWRRKRDLNPRYGIPYYTLSRGAPSASWVFLQIRFAMPVLSCLCILTQMQCLVKFFLHFPHKLF